MHTSITNDELAYSESVAKKVLVVEDDPDLREMVQWFWRKRVLWSKQPETEKRL